MIEKLVKFFETHPEATEVHVALGVLFTEKEKAESFVGGTTASVETFTKTGMTEPVVIVLDDAGAHLASEEKEVEAPVVDAPVVDAPVVDAPADVKEAIEKGEVLPTKAKAKVVKK